MADVKQDPAQAAREHWKIGFQQLRLRKRIDAQDNLTQLVAAAEVTRSLALYQRQHSLEEDIPEEKDSMSPHQAAVMICQSLVGGGVLGLPYALHKAGWAGLLFIILSSALAALTAKLLVWSFESVNTAKRINPRKYMKKGYITTYDQLVEDVFGTFGGTFAKVLTFVECYGTGTAYIVLHALNWPIVLKLDQTLFGMDTNYCVAAIVCCLAFPLTLVKIQVLAKLSVVSLIGSAALFIVVVVGPLMEVPQRPFPEGSGCALPGASAQALESLRVEGEDVTMSRALNLPEGYGYAIGLILFCFGGHATFPQFYQQMLPRDKKHFPAACNQGFSGACLFYVLVAVFGYYFYGTCSAGSLTLNLMQSSAIFGRFATLCVLVNTFFSYPAFLLPCQRILADWLYSKHADEVLSAEENLQVKTVQKLTARVEAQQGQIQRLTSALLHVVRTSSRAEEAKVLGLLEAETDALLAPASPKGAIQASKYAEEDGLAEADAHDSDCSLCDDIFQDFNLVTLLIRAGLCAGSFAITVAVPGFAFVVSLMGAFTTMLVSFILPALLYLRVHAHKLGMLESAAYVAIIIAGFAGMYLGVSSVLAG